MDNQKNKKKLRMISESQVFKKESKYYIKI